MSKLIYSNLSATGIHYPAIDHIYNIKEFCEEDDFLISCFWDHDIYNFKNSQPKIQTNRSKIREITREISKLLKALKIKHQIILLSDAIKRPNNHEDIYQVLLNCYNNITTGSLEDTYKKIDYLRLRPATLGKINFIVADYLIALFFKELYPSTSKGKRTDIYHTKKRFTKIRDTIEESPSQSEPTIKYPSVEYRSTTPIINYLNGNWFSTSTSKKEIEKILLENFPRDKNTLKDLIKISRKANVPSLNEKIDSFMKKVEKTDNKEILAKKVSEIFYQYFNHIKNLIASAEEGDIKKITYVDSKEKLKKILESINPAKLELLKLCNGKNPVDDIVKLSYMRESSVRSYISKMKKEKLLTGSKKPLRFYICGG